MVMVMVMVIFDCGMEERGQWVIAGESGGGEGEALSRRETRE